jgi:hypothetical protein
MKKIGIILVLAGISLIAALSMDVAKKNRSLLTISNNGTATRETAFMRLFATIGTVLVIAGVTATVTDQKPD